MILLCQIDKKAWFAELPTLSRTVPLNHVGTISKCAQCIRSMCFAFTSQDLCSTRYIYNIRVVCMHNYNNVFFPGPLM